MFAGTFDGCGHTIIGLSDSEYSLLDADAGTSKEYSFGLFGYVYGANISNVKLANVDIDMKNNRNEYVFRKEYAVIKGYRAWTYLQLALNYGRVPLVTEPILTQEEAERDYPKMGI